MNKIGEKMGEGKIQTYVEALYTRLGYQNKTKQANEKLMRLALDIHNTKKQSKQKQQHEHHAKSVSHIEAKDKMSINESKSNDRSKSRESMN